MQLAQIKKKIEFESESNKLKHITANMENHVTVHSISLKFIWKLEEKDKIPHINRIKTSRGV